MTTIINEIVYHIHPTYKLYAASAYGNVINTIERDLLKMSKTSKGYLYIRARKHDQIVFKRYLIHRFIWECLNGDIPEGEVIKHINHNKEDNQSSNLITIPIEHSHTNTLMDVWLKRRFKCQDYNKVIRNSHKPNHEKICQKNKSTEYWTVDEFNDALKYNRFCNDLIKRHKMHDEIRRWCKMHDEIRRWCKMHE